MANRINLSVSTAYANFFSEQSQTFDKTKEVVNQSNAQTKPQKLSPVEKTVSLTALGCDTELKLARAGYMAAAAKTGIADVGMQGRFADQMLAQNSQLTLNGSELDDAKVKSRLLNQSVDFTITDHEKAALEQFRAQYAKDGGKIRYNRTPTIDLRQARTADGVTNPLNSSPNKKYSVYLDNKGNPTDSKRVLAQFAEDQYKGGNLWGENYTRIAEMSVGQGVKPKIVNAKHVGNKVAVEFELTPLDRAKINENYKTVQAQVNEIEKIVAQINKDNPVSQFILGTVNGIKDNLVGTAMMVAHPLETLQTIKEAVVALSSLTTDDVAKIGELLKNKIKDTLTTRDGINSLPYGAGYVLGTVATAVVIGKGAGIALEGLKQIKPIATLLTKLENLKSLAKVKVAETFSDEAAQLAKQKFANRLKELNLSPNSITNIAADPELWARATQVAGNTVSKGYTKFADFSGQVIKELGEVARPHLDKLYRESLVSLDLSKGKQILSSSGKAVDEAVVREAKEKVIALVQENKVKELKELLNEVGGKYGTELQRELKNTVEETVNNIFEGRRTPEIYDMLGGHTIYDLFDGKIDTKHVGKTVEQLRERLGKEKIPFASSFKNLETANRAQMKFVKYYEKDIAEWLTRTNEPTFTGTLEMGEDLGKVVGRGKFGIKMGTKVEVTLTRNGTEAGWHIVTSYPTM